ncbi:MAG TPA: hypothetical protein VKR55_10090 [Bradyrhizobium sp.]|uniref:hypothetical protein n=1 Tax=Bradyrhizobium sp. TaxID=376 RepID=UPI002C393D94|nr:hypothetical protein [Bradyrhizobium sp.]HLZ02483.1 hypothetical protein [Bradyrhizobium sp.]
MKKSVALAIIFLLLPAFSAGAASSLHRKHVTHHGVQKAHPSEAAPKAPPVTRLPVAPDTFRA